MGTDRETTEGLAEKAARELRPNDNKDMAVGRGGVEGSRNIKEHVQRPCDRTEPGVFKKARVAGGAGVRKSKGLDQEGPWRPEQEEN